MSLANAFVVVLGLLGMACATERSLARVASDVHEHTGHAIDVDRRPEQAPKLPDGIVASDGLSADEAVAIALWNSPSMRADLARLLSAEADLAGAKRIANPTLRFLFPTGLQQLGLLLTWPLEGLIVLPRRVTLARKSLESVSQSIVQTALDLTRDVRLAHADWVLASERRDVRRDLASQWSSVASIVEARAELGDVSQREAEAARADAHVAADEATRADADVAMAQSRLRASMGWDPPQDLTPIAGPLPESIPIGAEELERVALESRPDLRAAQLGIEAAGARLGLERLAVLSLAGVVSGQGRAFTGGPQLVLPIFDQNQAGVQRARADLEASTWRWHGLRAQIVDETRRARAQLERSLGSFELHRSTLVEARRRDFEAATAEYELGEQDYTTVLLATQRLEAARLREVELAADVRRAAAELERALGRVLDGVAPEVSP